MTAAAKLAVAEEICRMRMDSDELIAREAPRMVAYGSEWLLNEFESLQAAWLDTNDCAALVTLVPLAPYYLRWLDQVAEARDAEAMKRFIAARKAAL